MKNQNQIILLFCESILFLGSIGGPFAFQGLMDIIPYQIKQVYSILHPIHGIIVYSLILLIVRPIKTIKQFNLLYAIPISILFSIGNFIHAEIGKDVPLFLIHLTNQLQPVIIMFLQIIFSIKSAKNFSKYEWTASFLLILGQIIYIQSFELNYHILLCLIKPLPLSIAFIYIEYLLKVKYKQLFPTYLWWSVCLWQTLVSIILSDLHFEDVQNAINCSWFGISDKFDCKNMPFWTFLGAFLSSCQNIPMPYISKYGGGHQVLIIRAIAFPFVIFGQLYINSTQIQDTNQYFSCFCASLALFLIAFNKNLDNNQTNTLIQQSLKNSKKDN